MSWWKKAQLENFNDRNRINAIAHRLKEFAESLDYAKKLIFQTGRGARAMVSQITDHETLSSFPTIRDLLKEADKTALDNPHKFADFCQEAAVLMKAEVEDIELQRHHFLAGDEGKPRKGLVDE